MSEPAAQVAPHRATILVGYGAFGLDVLRRLLASTAPRGVLTWEESRDGAAPSERHLQDLALLWVPDRLGVAGQAVDEENAGEASGLEMMRDLYRQIQQIGHSAGPAAPAAPEAPEAPEAAFAEALDECAGQLLSASTRAGRRGALPLGLDVVVLARPTGREVVGTLDRLLVRGMERLANNANLQRAVQGAEALNFLAVLDFENYWDRSEPGRSVRRAVHDLVEQSRKRRAAGRPAFARFYFVDGRNDEGIRDARHRTDEISLFLELLLFEGQRGGELQRLYQSPGALESPVATFGIRLMERSAGLLSHLAAARFGIGWLEYLAGKDGGPGDGEPSELRQRLAPYRPAALDELLDGAALRGDVQQALAALEEELAALPTDLPDWPAQVRVRYEETARRLELRLTEKAHARMTELVRHHLAQLPEDLRAGIEADLHRPRDPAPLGAVIAELEEALAALEAAPPPVAAPAPGGAGEMLQRLAELHAGYQRFHLERVRVEGLRQWWPLFAVALSAGLTPVLHELLSDVPPPDPLRFLLDRAYAALQWINTPLVLGALLFLAVWGLGAWGLQKRIAARIERARRFYNDPERGRFIDRLRSGLQPGGALRAPLDALLDRLLLDMALSVRGEVTRELGRVLERLHERRREMLWLRNQLRGFLRLHGLRDDMRPEMGRLARNGTGIRYAVESGEDLEGMLRSNPPGPERFRSTQASLSPFAGWDERYSPAFLEPLVFIDRLSAIYMDPFQRELAQPGTGPEQARRAAELLEFLERRGALSLAFRWQAQEGVLPDRRYCLLPNLWRRLPGVLPALSDLRMSEEAVLPGADVGRAYLLRLQIGVDPRCLLEPE